MSNGPTQPFEEHPDRVSKREYDVLALNAVFTFLATISVIVRFITRKYSSEMKFWWDDWMILVALVAAIAFLVLGVVDRTVGGAGYHIETYSREQLTIFFKVRKLHQKFLATLSLAVTVVYNISLTFSKASVLFLYERIFFVSDRLRIWIRITMFILVAYLLSASFGLIFTTNPVQAQWKYWIPHTTIHKLPFYIVIGVANLLLDIVILSMPQAIVWKLHQSLQKRISIAAVFMLGGFVCIASIVRITALLTIKTNDLTFSFHNSTIWTLIEMDVSIICACLPVMPKTVKVFKQKYGHSAFKPTSSSREAPLKGESGYWLSADSNNNKRASGTAVSSFSQGYRVLPDSNAGDTQLVTLAPAPSVHLKHNYEIVEM
ncbi:hypothetical protein PISL3812_04539 [Talaromyces islandicus]|uniref:Rhodopsin domain-containing protein n=1 Tax=Talaromyces islandicus TaxID=28573 RepID=A0A0U1LXV0_TALIS|nr:hypothetical protein PISL3812_04539 [Talaromyces islandicus]